MPQIEKLEALEILDSRGRPTVRATCQLQNGARASASVPSGASTGAAEALELRDGEPKRYGGLGCRRAVNHVNHELSEVLCGRQLDQGQLDAAMCELDGTPNKARLGANAILSVSLAFARVTALEQGVPLYQYFANLINEPLPARPALTLPRLTVNLYSGGKHAGGQVAIQDILIVPVAAQSMDESLAMTYAVYQAAARHISEKYGVRLLRADEGGLAPPAENSEALLEDAMVAIRSAGFEPGHDIALAIDVASTHFYENGIYNLDGPLLDSRGMIERLAEWVERFPLVSIEDGLAEDDWEHWPQLRQTIGGKALVLGDDLLCTNPNRIRRAAQENAADALLLKVNQVGTLTEAIQARQLARAAEWKITVSARSGETEDDWLADLAVGWQGDFIKIGSITQSERLAKYNRLLELETTQGLRLLA